MSATAAWGLVCGCLLGLGLWSILAATPRFSRPRLIDRVAPYVVDVSGAAREHVDRRTVHPLPIIGAVFGPALATARSAFARVFGGADVALLRLRQAASPISLDRYRSEQLLAALAGVVLGLVVGVAAVAVRSVPPALVVVLPVAGAVVGVALRDLFARRAAASRIRRMTEELPTVLEFLTLSLSAGEGILDALRRVAATSSGELAAEFSTVVARVGTGVPLSTALEELSAALRLPALSRAVDQVTAALERGTPLAGVLRDQAHDARSDAKNRLLETAGRKEVAMLVPLVFLILPLTVVIAIFPGLFVLQAGF